MEAGEDVERGTMDCGGRESVVEREGQREENGERN